MGFFTEELKTAKEAVAAQASPQQRRRLAGGAGQGSKASNGKPESQVYRKKLVDPAEIHDLEKMDVEEIQKWFPILMKLVLNVAMKQRHVESIIMTTLICPETTAPMVKARIRVTVWIKAAEKIRETSGAEAETACRSTKPVAVGGVAVASPASLTEG